MAFRPFITNLLGLDGTPESGGLLQSYVKDTTTPLPLYSDAGVTPRTNPIVAESLGQVTAYFNDALSYSWQAKTADNATTLWRADVVAGVLTLTFVNPDYDVFPIVDLAAVRSTSTYAALTGLMAATGLIDGAVYVTKARSSADDGGHGQWRYDAASVATADGGTVLAKDGGGAGRFFRLWNGSVDPRWFGASSSALAAANTTAFGSIPRGSIVDLQGLTYTVTDAAAIIFDLHLINGALKVGSARYPMPRLPQSNPLGEGGMVIESGLDHPWPGPAGYVASTDRIVGAYSTANRHEINLGTIVSVERSFDGGIEFVDGEQESSNDSDRRGLVGGMFSASRFSLVYCLHSASAVTGNVARYTDDGGVTLSDGSWTGNAIFPHGDPIFNDSGHMVVTGYGLGGLYKAVSTDGAAWTSTLILPTANFPVGTSLTECCLIKVDTAKYVLIARDDNGGNLRATTSTDLSTWTAWADTGLDTNGNPPAAFVEWGKLWVYQVARNSQKVDGYQDALLCYSLDPDAVYAAGGSFGTLPAPVVVYRAKRTCIGYLTIFRIMPGRYQGYMLDGEDTQDSTEPATARIVALGDIVHRGAIMSASKRQERVFPLSHNSTFQHWMRGTSFASISARTMTADRWSVSASTETATVSRVAVDDAIANNLPWRPHYAMWIQSASGGDGRQLYQRHPGRTLAKALSGRRVFAYIAVSGTWPFYVRATATINFGSGGSSEITDFANSLQAHTTTGVTFLRAELTIPFIDGKTWGTNPYVDLKFLFNDTGTMDAYIYGAWFACEDSRFLPPSDVEDERALLDRYCERLDYGPTTLVDYCDFGSATSGVWPAEYLQKVSTPAISIATGYDFGDLVQNTSPALTGLTFDLIGLRTARGVLVGSGLSTGRQELRSSGDGFSLLVDCGL